MLFRSNYNTSVLENNASLPNFLKVEGNVINDAELNNSGWFEIGVE